LKEKTTGKWKHSWSIEKNRQRAQLNQNAKKNQKLGRGAVPILGCKSKKKALRLKEGFSCTKSMTTWKKPTCMKPDRVPVLGKDRRDQKKPVKTGVMNTICNIKVD